MRFSLLIFCFLIVIALALGVGLGLGLRSESKKSLLLTPIEFMDKMDIDDIVFRIRKLIEQLGIKHVVIWGHPLASHTHSYIHDAFYRTTQFLEIDSYWVPQVYLDTKHIPKYDGPVENTLFITEGQVVHSMPISPHAWYICHNVDTHKIFGTEFPTNHLLSLQYYHFGSPLSSLPVFDKFHRIEIDQSLVYMPWATDLLPHEFQRCVSAKTFDYDIGIIGQNGAEYKEKIDRFIAGFPSDVKVLHDDGNSVIKEKMIFLLRQSKYAPAIVTQWQKEHGYIPCRIMKNISYGQIPITNTWNAHEMLIYQTLFHDDEVSLANLVQKTDRQQQYDMQKRAATLVRQRHTYLNRFEFILYALQSRISPFSSPLRVLHMTLHRGCAKVLQQISQQLHWDYFEDWFMLDTSRNDEGNKIYNMTKERANKYWEKFQSQLCSFTHVIVSDTAPLARILLSHMDTFKGKVIIWVCNQFDYAHYPEAEIEGFPDNDWYQLIQRSHDRVHVVSYNKVEQWYAVSKNVFWQGRFSDLVIPPVYRDTEKSPSVVSYLPETVQNNKANYLFIPPYHNDERFIDFNFLDQQGILYYRGRYNGPNDLLGFRGILHIPYTHSNLALFENLDRQIPYYIPSLSFFHQFKQQANFVWPSAVVPEITEWYQAENAAYFVYFNGWIDFCQKYRDNAGEKQQGVATKLFEKVASEVLYSWQLLMTNST